MPDVYTTSIGVPKMARNKRIYGDGSSFSSTTVQSSSSIVQATVTPSEKFPFTNEPAPTILDYNNLWNPTHGQDPRIELVIDNGDGTRYRSQQQPQFTLVAGTDLIETIFFDLGEAKTGYIILN